MCVSFWMVEEANRCGFCLTVAPVVGLFSVQIGEVESAALLEVTLFCDAPALNLANLHVFSQAGMTLYLPAEVLFDRLRPSLVSVMAETEAFDHL